MGTSCRGVNKVLYSALFACNVLIMSNAVYTCRSWHAGSVLDFDTSWLAGTNEDNFLGHVVMG